MQYLVKGLVETLIVGVVLLVLLTSVNLYFLSDTNSSNSPSYRDVIAVFSVATLAITPLVVFYERLRRIHKISPLSWEQIISAVIGAGLAMLIVSYIAFILAWNSGA